MKKKARTKSSRKPASRSRATSKRPTKEGTRRGAASRNRRAISAKPRARTRSKNGVEQAIHALTNAVKALPMQWVMAADQLEQERQRDAERAAVNPSAFMHAQDPEGELQASATGN